MVNERKRRYAVNFDLSIGRLREYYSQSNPKKAYYEISRYMHLNGFTHRQWSGYVSDKPMTRTMLLEFVRNMHKHFSWLVKCEDNMDATVITDIFDIKQLILEAQNDDEDMSI